MAHTLAEMILARAALLPSVSAGQAILARPDFVLAYDPDVDQIISTVREQLGVTRVPDPTRFGILIDHMVPAATPREEEIHIRVRAWCNENGVDLFERQGIGHQVACRWRNRSQAPIGI